MRYRFLSLFLFLIASSASGMGREETMARQIYGELCMALGDDRQAPALAIGKLDDVQVARYDRESRTIQVEPAALEVCADFGERAPQAMAALLGHELAHFYLGHYGMADFGVKSRTRDKFIVVEEFEREADVNAGFYAYLAGYPTKDIMSELLEKLYQAYDLPSDMPGYPSLAQRQATAKHAEAFLSDALWAFEAGKRLLLVGRYTDAAIAFDRAASDFPSREVLNNAGLARVMEVLAGMDSGEFPWILPLQCDHYSRATDPSTQVASGGVGARMLRRKQCLEEASQRFEKARLKSPSYAVASLNLACAKLLMGQSRLAEGFAEEAGRIASATRDSATVQGAELLKALILAVDNRRDEAEKLLRIMPKGTPWVAENLMVLSENGAGPKLPKRSVALPAPDEALAGWKPWDRKTWQDADWTLLKVEDEKRPPLLIYHAERPGVFAVRCVRASDESMAAITRPAYGGATASNIKMGSSSDQVLKAYGKPAKVDRMAQGEYWLYSGLHLGLLIKNGRVAEWMLN